MPSRSAIRRRRVVDSRGSAVVRFDSLVHVTRDGTWIDGRHDASYMRLLRELDAADVQRACLVGVAGVVDNGYVLECARNSGRRLVPIAGINPSSFAHAASAAGEVETLAGSGFAGIKLHPRLNGFEPQDVRALEAIRAASARGLVVFLDTFFRQRAHAARHAADTIDAIAHDCPEARIVLLHGGGAALLEVAEVVRVHPSLILDLSYTLLRYEGSSLDLDLRWVMSRLDQRVVIGSDMPEFTPAAAFARATQLADGLPADKWANISHRNLERLFA
jgi:predicted TIM-barrel fold metal-dependent hydrolase